MNVRSIGCGSIYEAGYSYRTDPADGEYLLVSAYSEIMISIDGKADVYPENTAILFDGSIATRLLISPYISLSLATMSTFPASSA